MRRVVLTILALAAIADGALAQTIRPNGYDCPRGLKLAAGACVQQCPAGYADNGSRCDFRSMGDGGGGK